MAPDERSLRADLASARFLAGEDRGRWALRDLRWPHLFADVAAPDGRRFTLRLDCAGFPAGAPTGTFWDLAADCRLPFPRWPTGGERISLAFKPGWKDGAALYIPCDRESIAGHDQWPAQYPQLIWNPAKGISHYLGVVHDLLHSRDYACAAA
ncbi:hypothetical protein FN976_11445 [Caenimonas sedimenti]|uniref:Uncharacterized protein n=1 Tax=Caenimonas sedimenti TaxID=2596921 RepID=A0A562ZT20_9BURK|nr:hypothetical protein [Caenimonas sedimenti]TWO71521.1 hypothetical protein FN976_11445 [Caenimonas sedimenti]